jgi:hypothetical protein
MSKLLLEIPACDIPDLQFKILSRTKIIEMNWPSFIDHGPCWEWQGGTSGKHSNGGRGWGYGRVSYKGQMRATHRISYMVFKGRLTTSKQVDHLCGNRLCCNPKHLKATTCLQNNRLRSKRAKEKAIA